MSSQDRNGSLSRAAVAALTVTILFALTVVLTQSAQAQTFKVIHTFTGPDGADVYAGVTLDAAGNLYGTTSERLEKGGGPGTVFELKPSHGNWILNSIFTFNGNDGYEPWSGVVFGPDGDLYGTTFTGGSGSGVVYSLKPAATACETALCPWTETVLYQFTGGSDGADPAYGNLTFDRVGNLYGTTPYGGNSPSDWGLVFELTPSNGGWTERVLYSFSGGNDGEFPFSGVILDEAGNLYGTSVLSGDGGCQKGCWGTVYQLTPSGAGWKENTLYTFQDGTDGGEPYGGLIFDASGNLYGSTYLGGSGFGGTVFELSPAGGSWTFALVYAFTGSGGPYASLAMDGTGSLYGTTYLDGFYGQGNVFKLTPSSSGWTYASLYDFTGGNDGAYPIGSLVLDKSGNIYGTTSAGGANGKGVVFEITP
jgi:uncharacterized repeat protein (TIGR03803 family)